MDTERFPGYSVYVQFAAAQYRVPDFIEYINGFKESAIMSEKTFFDDQRIRVTSLRLDFKNETIPIDHIQEVRVRFKVFNIVAAFLCFFLSLVTLFVPELGRYGLLIVAVFFIWLTKVFSSYVELWLVVENAPVFILHASLTRCRYIYSIEDAINAAMVENKAKKSQGNLEYTDTMKFKLRMQDYQ
jgi:hypothetical protein